MGKTSMAERVIDFMRTQNFSPRSIVELSRDVVAVEDTMCDVDIYYDVKKCNLKDCPSFFEEPQDPNILLLGLSRNGLGLIPGKLKRPPIKGVYEALRYAKEHLEPKLKTGDWYNFPRRLN